ncbi:MAG: S1C family serine protease [Gaiellaceae bacterium]
MSLALAAAVVVTTLSVATGGDGARKTPVVSAPGNTGSSKDVSAGGVALQNAFAAVYREVSPSVVQIQTSEGLGSGVVFDDKGDIVTNNHVVGTSKTFLVTTSTGSGKELKGRLVGAFPVDDLAVIRVDGSGLRPARFADSARVRVGDIALAIGNPLGLNSSVTEGIVSALNRSEPEGNGVVLPSAIQTSAAINPGNSGGALVDIRGEVIGIPTLAAVDPELGGAAAGIGFAIPSNVVTTIAGQLVKYGKVINSNRAYLGVKVADTGELNGVYITKVFPGSAAAKAGLKVGELITTIAGVATPDATSLDAVLAGLKPGRTVTITYVTQTGKTGKVRLELGQYPGGAG